MKEDFSELVEYLDGKFNTIDGRFEKTAAKEDIQAFRTEMDQKFLRAFDVFSTKDEIKELATRIERLEESVHALTNAVDKLAKAVDDLRIEYSAMTMQVSRHEKWIQQIAGKLGLKLDY